jgi:uncharacterized protein YkwD
VLSNVAGKSVAIDTSIPGANTGFMHSPPHRANILNRQYNAVGIGVVWKGTQVWVTEDFANRVSARSISAHVDARCRLLSQRF